MANCIICGNPTEDKSSSYCRECLDLSADELTGRTQGKAGLFHIWREQRKPPAGEPLTKNTHQANPTTVGASDQDYTITRQQLFMMGRNIEMMYKVFSINQAEFSFEDRMRFFDARYRVVDILLSVSQKK